MFEAYDIYAHVPGDDLAEHVGSWMDRDLALTDARAFRDSGLYDYVIVFGPSDIARLDPDDRIWDSRTDQ